MPDVNITPSENGPYIVSGPVVLTAPDGRVIEHPDPMAMCRCGQSKNKPFCDGTHATIDFDGTETASREPFDRQATVVHGPEMVLQDAEPLCAFARFCDNAGTIWVLIERTDDRDVREIVAYEG